MLDLTPKEFWVMNIEDFFIMTYYKSVYLDKQRDYEMQRTAWFTSGIMTATGRYKKPVSPNKLYKSRYENGKPKKVIDKEYVDNEIEKLKDIFDIKDN